nr:MAG TPA: Terminase [Caudoviricetes sp.]
MTRDEVIKLGAKMELARRHLYDFCKMMYPSFYKDERKYLKEFCEAVENFINDKDKRFLIINMPPRHGKSLTDQCLTAWLLGRDPTCRVMTASYNEDVASVFSKNVRNTIQTEKIGERVVFFDMFPKTKVKYGDASAKKWTIDGQSQISYLATSPNGTATGFGCDYLICDDLIKSAEEAYNETALDNTYQWFVNTMLSRLEGQKKCIIVMTRWSSRDLAGRIMEAFPDECEIIKYHVQNDKGEMLCEDILNEKDMNLIKREMNVDIFEANYNQTPIDVKGRLYQEFKEWEKLPSGKIINFTDTADTGSDFLCSINGVVFEKEFYISDLVFSDEAMEVTEPKVAELLFSGAVNVSRIESNNGGRGFARNVQRLMNERYGSNRTQIESVPQTHNKESRILASSAWVQNHIYMPPNWRTRFPEFYKQVMSYQRKGKNAHDDALDVLASIYEFVCGDDRRPTWASSNEEPRLDRAISF